MEPSTLTQDDFPNDEYTEFNEGFVSYMFGHFLWENPYNSTCYKSYLMWYDGWQAGLEKFPEFEPKEE